MRKGWIVLLTAILVVAFAAPAMADLKVTGFYRAKAMLSDFFDGSGGPSLRSSDAQQTNAYVEQRARLKFDVGTENARAVFHFESDMNWGVGSGNSYVDDDTSGGASDFAAVSNGRNGGGALSADTVQLETKELYVWFKIPDTSITAKVGMQSVDDHYAGIFSNAADMTGVFVNGQFEPVKWSLGWAKLYETNGGGASGGYDAADDTDFYLASVQFAPSKDMSLGVNFYYLADNSGNNSAGLARLDPFQGLGAAGPLDGYVVDVYMPGVNFAMNLGPAKMSAFGFYQFGTADSWNGTSIDISSFMLDARVDLKLGPGNLFVEGFYISGGDGTATATTTPSSPSATTRGATTGPTNSGTGGNSGFGRTNMYFLFGADSQNVSQCLIGCSGGELGDSFGNSGRGLWHVAAGYSQKFTEKLQGSVNVGYAAASDTYASDDAEGRDKDIGTEFNARVDYTISKGLTLSLVGAYLIAGDFVTAAEDLDDSYYMGYARRTSASSREAGPRVPRKRPPGDLPRGPFL